MIVLILSILALLLIGIIWLKKWKSYVVAAAPIALLLLSGPISLLRGQTIDIAYLLFFLMLIAVLTVIMIWDNNKE